MHNRPVQQVDSVERGLQRLYRHMQALEGSGVGTLIGSKVDSYVVLVLGFTVKEAVGTITGAFVNGVFVTSTDGRNLDGPKDGSL